MTVYEDEENATKIGLFETKEKDIKKIKKMLENEFKITKCNHEHDCCGCVCRVRIENIFLLKHDLVSACITWSFNV